MDPDAPLELLGPLGCGIQTGAGAVFNVLRPLAGESLAVFGTGSVGLAAVMAARAVGAGTIIAVDVLDHRLELAKELGATHGVNPNTTDPVDAIREITGGGVDYSLEMTARPEVFTAAISSLATLGTVGIVEGDSVPDIFIPRLVDLIVQGRFPLERLVSTYGLEQVNGAAQATETGTVVKPVLVLPA